MNRTQAAYEYHRRGFNCCQSVLAAFSDLTGLSEQDSFQLGAGFGAGAGTGELCGAVSGAVMALGMLTPFDADHPAESKKRTVALSKELQSRFREKFDALRCQELLQKKFVPTPEVTPAAAAMGVTGHCSIMVVTAVELAEEILEESRKAS